MVITFNATKVYGNQAGYTGDVNFNVVADGNFDVTPNATVTKN